MSQHLTASGEKGCEELYLSRKHYSSKVKPFLIHPRENLALEVKSCIFANHCQIPSVFRQFIQ